MTARGLHVLGLDLGTSGIRAVALDVRAGTVTAAASAPVAVTAAGASLTSDADEILGTARDLLRRVVAVVRESGGSTAAISCSVQGEAFVPVDARGEVAGPVPVSMDRTGRAWAERTARELGGPAFRRTTGQPLHPMFSVFKIAAVESRGVAGLRYRGLADHVLTELADRRVRPTTDLTQAARTGLFDVGRSCWSADVAAAAGVRADLLGELPEVVAAGTPVGRVGPRTAEELGLDAGTLLVVGAHDQAAAFLGGGGTPDGRAVLSLGSSECLTVGSPRRPTLPESGLASYPLGPGWWLTLAGTAAGGWGLQWLADFAGAGDDVARQALLDTPSAAPTAVMVLPFFAGSGTLDNDPDRRAVITGLDLRTGPAQVVRALYESSGYEVARILDALGDGVRVHEIRCVGTGSRNTAALQLRADAADRVLVPDDPDAAARGAALLAARGAGLPEPPAAAAGDPVRPAPEHRDHHTARRAEYHRLVRVTGAHVVPVP